MANKKIQFIIFTMLGKPIHISIPVKYFMYIALIIISGWISMLYFIQDNMRLGVEVSSIELQVEEKNEIILALIEKNEIQSAENLQLKNIIDAKNKIIHEKASDIEKQIEEINAIKEYIQEYTNQGLGGSSPLNTSNAISRSELKIRDRMSVFEATKDDTGTDNQNMDIYYETLQSSIEEFKHLVIEVEDRKDYLDRFPDFFPATGSITSPFGYRISPFDFQTTEFHYGIDIANSQGTQIFVAGKGKIVEVSYNHIYGKHVIVDHGYGFETLYAHLTTIYGNHGDYVEKGELIGTMGSTGLSTGPHLHFEIRIDDETVNPLNIKKYYD